MREATILNLCAETLSLSSFVNGNSLGRLRAPNGLPFPYLLPSVKRPRDLALWFHGGEETSPPQLDSSTVILVFWRCKTVRMPHARYPSPSAGV